MKSFPKLKGKAILSPMVGVTDVAFRVIAKKCGAALTCTEFVSASAVVRCNPQTMNILKTDRNEKPVAVQLFGNNIKEIVKAGQMLEKKFDIIDFNCGCPDRKVIRHGAGSELLKKPNLIYKIIDELSNTIKKPVTLKMRTGINNDSNAIKIAKLAEKAGVAAITVHGRTQKQMYDVKANWNVIKKIKKSVGIPVIGNGDVFSPEIFKQKLDESGVDYISIGRWSMGNPCAFTQIRDYLKKDSYKKENNFALFKDYLKLAKKHKLDLSSIKRQAIYFTKGEYEATKLRAALMKSKTIEEIKEIMILEK